LPEVSSEHSITHCTLSSPHDIWHLPGGNATDVGGDALGSIHIFQTFEFLCRAQGDSWDMFFFRADEKNRHIR
jgi:hypothetical protein